MRTIAVLSDETKIASVSAFCILALAVALKNVLHVPAEQLSRDMILFIIVYSGFWMLPAFTMKRENKSALEGALVWSALIVAITLAIIAVYAV